MVGKIIIFVRTLLEKIPLMGRMLKFVRLKSERVPEPIKHFLVVLAVAVLFSPIQFELAVAAWLSGLNFFGTTSYFMLFNVLAVVILLIWAPKTLKKFKRWIF